MMPCRGAGRCLHLIQDHQIPQTWVKVGMIYGWHGSKQTTRGRDNPIPRVVRLPEELFQCSSDRNSSKVGEPSSKEPFQMSKETINTPQTDTAVGTTDQRQSNDHVQGTPELVRDTQPDSTLESLQSFSPSTKIKDGKSIQWQYRPRQVRTPVDIP